jgi:membrane fusion protein (multidrug efflux system)
LKAYAFVALLLLAIFGSIGGYLYNKISTFASMDFTPPPVTVTAGLATTEGWAQYLHAVGTVRSVRGVRLSSETSGEVTQLNFESGDQVETGQVLLVMNDQIEQAARRSQIASLELAEILFERDRQLVDQKSIPQSQYDRSKADLARARAQLAETEARIHNKRIHAPFAGTIGIRQVSLGDYLAPGTTIGALEDLSELEVDFSLPGRVTPLLSTGMPVQLTVDAFPDKLFEARLFALDSRVDEASRSLLVRARLDNDVSLLPGMFARVRVEISNSAVVITVPETALTYSVNGDTVYVVGSSGEGLGQSVEAVVVEVGQVRNGRVEIRKGILQGDLVVTSGQNKLYRGARITVDPTMEF